MEENKEVTCNVITIAKTIEKEITPMYIDSHQHQAVYKTWYMLFFFQYLFVFRAYIDRRKILGRIYKTINKLAISSPWI